ncbi:MAG: nucleoside deaminase [Alphaproteobacteria bacterium]|nr:nucleoside deaminase [Alphaproteobacteria bacterium]MCB9985702.1 nucleoside deaminase [Micavibrio sp.]HPQ50395.1 nucleoside deaminase [Alphaproteobacteria bacterium]HRK97666.1 nucleoside deaminase [Alphaproteobacteria bacterium]
MSDDIYHTRMQAALEEARCAALRDEVPIGAVLVHRESGEIKARAGNRTIELCDPTAHAEIQVIRTVCLAVQAQRLPEYDLYVSLEPCPMCAAAISFARIETVYFGAADPKSGGLTSSVNLYSHAPLHHKPKIVSGLLEEECAQILREFFKAKR